MPQGFDGDELIFGYASTISNPGGSCESRDKARLYDIY